jgi:hypothetical protein
VKVTSFFLILISETNTIKQTVTSNANQVPLELAKKIASAIRIKPSSHSANLTFSCLINGE